MLNNEKIKLFFEGKLSAEESSAVAELIAGDELYREAFGSMNAESFLVVENISHKTNNRIDQIIGKAPFFYRWGFWMSVIVGTLFISFSVYYFLPANQNNTSVAQNENPNKESNKKNNIVQTVVVGEPIQKEIRNDNTLNYNEPTDNSNLVHAITKKKKDSTDNKSNDKKANDQVVSTDKTKINLEDKYTQVVTNNPEKENTTQFTNRKYRLRVSDAMVTTTQNLAEKEASSGDNRNHDVRDPNIGSDLSKKTVEYNMEDMPYYPGGSEALNSYVVGKLSMKSYQVEQKSFSTMVEFVVTSKGKVEDVKVQNKLDPKMESDIIEILSAVKFNAGKKSGKKGSMFYRMSLVYARD